METFRSFWKPRGTIAIPSYTVTDGVDLQVKSLLYVYKRLGIAKSTDKLEKQSLPDISEDDLLNLDKMFNIDGFIHIVLETDPHRVLVDWPKNRFRAMLLLAHMPQIEHLPSFSAPNYSFHVLEADASNDEYIRTLSSSNIYAEHNLPTEVRREIAASIVRKNKHRDLQARADIVLEYLHLVATEIQVARIYKAMMAKVNNSPNSSSPVHSQTKSQTPTSPIPGMAPQSPNNSAKRLSRSPSPIRSGPPRFPKAAPLSAPPHALNNTPMLNASLHSPSVSPTPSPPRSPTLAHTHLGSPTSPQHGGSRLRLKPSQQNLKLGQTPQLTSQNTVSHSIDAGKKHILQQARLAVRARLEKEERNLSTSI